MVMRWAFWGGLLLLISFWISLSGDIGMYVDLPTIIYLLVFVVIYAASHHKFSSVFRSTYACLGGKHQIEHDELVYAQRVFCSARRGAWIGGVLWSVTGMIAVLSHLTEAGSVALAVAHSLLGVFYALLLAELVLAPLERNFEDRLSHAASSIQS